MVDQFEDERVIDFNEAVNRIIDDFGRKHGNELAFFQALNLENIHSKLVRKQ